MLLKMFPLEPGAAWSGGERVARAKDADSPGKKHERPVESCASPAISSLWDPSSLTRD